MVESAKDTQKDISNATRAALMCITATWLCETNANDKHGQEFASLWLARAELVI